MNQALDQEQLEKVLGGDQDAFRYFITNYQQLAFRIALSMVKEEQQAKLVVQNAFIQAYKSLGSFRLESKFSTWLYRIVVNESIKANRKSKQAQRTIPIVADHSVYSHVENGALDAMAQKERSLQIHRVLAQMKAKERLMLELFYLQEKSISEIAAITGFTTSNVKVLLHRARKNFATFFKPPN